MRQNKTSRQISNAKIKELKNSAAHILADARSEMLNTIPFIGSIAMSLSIIPVRDRRVSTACCDGKNIFFDIDFLSTLKKDQICFVIAHEVWHAVMSHMLRLNGRDMHLFNIAADIEINELLAQEGFSVIKDACTAAAYNFDRGLSAEEYYELLLNDDDSQSDSQSNDSINQNGQGQSKSGQGQSQGQSNSGNFDQHIYSDQNPYSDPNPNQTISDKYGEVGYDDDYQPNIKEDHAKAIQEVVVAAAQRHEAQGRGELPANIKRLIDNILNPQLPWQELLSQFVTRQCGADANWNKPNRRFVSRGLYLPSHQSNTLNIAVGLDTSGSTDKNATEFLSEINGILSTVESYQVHFVECDAEVGKYEVYDNMNPFNFDNYEMTGGGGTRLKPIFEKLEEENAAPDCAIIFTDGECEQFTEDDDPGYPVLWIITQQINDLIRENLPFGELVEMKA